MDAPRTYLVIDLKSFYASAECAERGLDPMTTNLVVADESRTEKTICLAVSPSLKAYGISGRARLFEVVQRVKEINAERLQEAIRQNQVGRDEKGRYVFSGFSYDDTALQASPSLGLSYITAPPHMAKYVDLSGQIHAIYLRYIAPEDIHSYSIDEVFIDLTRYLSAYRTTAHDLARAMIQEVFAETGVIATAGIGPNLYLAKIAADIRAKHVPADADGVRIAELTVESYRSLLWDHRPITDFWRIGRGTARTLAKREITTMGELARASLSDPEWFYQAFGIDAEILIDHAWGVEPCTMEDIKNYHAETHCLCEGQVLSEPYPYEKGEIIVREMAENLGLELAQKGMVTESLTMDLGYDRENVDRGRFRGEIHIDHYGRSVPKPAHGSIRLEDPTNLADLLIEASVRLYERIADPNLLIRRVTITANRIREDEGYTQLSLFADTEKQEKEKRLQDALLSIKGRYGKNAVLRGTSLEEGATQQQRSGQIGGHQA